MNIHSVFRPLLLLFRKRRMRRFAQSFGLARETTVLDVGGTPFNWSLIEESPRLFLCNLRLPPGGRRGMRWVVADACRLPFRDRSFDVAFSNSVIEHVGDRASQKAFARECTRVGRRYFVQTPNKWFFLEPHLLTPFVHWLPFRFGPWAVRNLTVRAWISRPSREWAREFVEQTRLLGHGELRELFPAAEIRRERFLGLTKALLAVGAGDAAKATAPEDAGPAGPHRRAR